MLLQIFGFRDERKVSFIDKDLMKLKFLDATVNQTYGKEDVFEQF